MDHVEESWSHEDNKMLENLIIKLLPDWGVKNEYVQAKLAQSCESRWLSLQTPFTPEEDKMLQYLVKKHGSNWSLIGKSIPARSDLSCWLRWVSLQMPFPPEEDKKLRNLRNKHGFNWSLISKSIPGRSCELRWISLQYTDLRFTPEEDDTILRAHKSFGNNWEIIAGLGLLGGRSAKAIMDRWNSTLKWKSGSSMTDEDITIEGQGNLSHEVGGVRGKAPSIGDMARDNVSRPSGGTHSYSRDISAPSWNALNKRDSSTMMIDSDNVQEFVWDEFGWNDSSEVSSKKYKKRVVTNDS